MSELFEKYRKAREEKNSLLCVGLDPSPQEVNEDAMADWCLDKVERTGDYAIAFKPNSQYVLFTLKKAELRNLNRKIRLKGCISILDHKLSDIGSTNEAALYHIHDMGYDALTASPFPGNIKETTDLCHRNKLGVFFLTLMSNSQAEWIQKQSLYEGMPLYQKIADEVRAGGADGLVIGTTGHVSAEDIVAARQHAGSGVIFLCPGIGAQGGDMEKIIKNAGQNTLVNVGRAIFSDVSPKKKAGEYRDMINRYR
jgi:orotidine 5'-phosphate decarboxylase subfamily 2